jgi:AraC-like DNA-binding protein
LFQLTFFVLWILQKKRCWACGSLDVIKWGKQLGKQRYKCKSCTVLFTATNKGVSVANRFIWFREWVIGRQTIAQICKASGYSERTLKRYFDRYLSEAPVFKVKPSERVNLLIDATYFSNNLCLVLYRDNTIKYTQLYRLTDGEWYDEIKEDLQNLIDMGVQIESITCDGHKSLLKAIRKVCKHVILQRCLVHIQLLGRIWLTMRPKSQASSDLRIIINKLHTIKTHDQRDYWIVSLVRWHLQYEDYIKEKSYSQTGNYWYKHKMLRRSFTVIRRVLPNMFHYLDNNKIPKSTNGLESFFGHLKSHITVHRGLSKLHRRNFIKWYLYFKNG